MLNRSECKKMWVWDDSGPKGTRIVIETFNNGSCRVVYLKDEEAFYGDKHYKIEYWDHYEEIPETKMRPMTEAEILGWQAHAKGWIVKCGDSEPHPVGYYLAHFIVEDIEVFRRAPITESGVTGEWEKFEVLEDNDVY